MTSRAAVAGFAVVCGLLLAPQAALPDPKEPAVKEQRAEERAAAKEERRAENPAAAEPDRAGPPAAAPSGGASETPTPSDRFTAATDRTRRSRTSEDPRRAPITVTAWRISMSRASW